MVGKHSEGYAWTVLWKLHFLHVFYMKLLNNPVHFLNSRLVASNFNYGPWILLPVLASYVSLASEALLCAFHILMTPVSRQSSEECYPHTPVHIRSSDLQSLCLKCHLSDSLQPLVFQLRNPRSSVTPPPAEMLLNLGPCFFPLWRWLTLVWNICPEWELSDEWVGLSQLHPSPAQNAPTCRRS